MRPIWSAWCVESDKRTFVVNNRGSNWSRTIMMFRRIVRTRAKARKTWVATITFRVGLRGINVGQVSKYNTRILDELSTSCLRERCKIANKEQTRRRSSNFLNHRGILSKILETRFELWFYFVKNRGRFYLVFTYLYFFISLLLSLFFFSSIFYLSLLFYSNETWDFTMFEVRRI